jgi:hypothetical protein
MGEFMYKEKIFICLMLVLNIFSCVKDKNEAISKNNYDDIINFLEINRDAICGKNYYKGIMVLHLIDEQKEFYNNRLTYFINILKEDEINKKQYYDEHYNFMRLFQNESIGYFFNSMNIFDYWLFDLIEKNFENRYFPINYFKEYYMDYRMMINQENLK